MTETIILLSAVFGVPFLLLGTEIIAKYKKK